jgi:hypothetical protein
VRSLKSGEDVAFIFLAALSENVSPPETDKDIELDSGMAK